MRVEVELVLVEVAVVVEVMVAGFLEWFLAAWASVVMGDVVGWDLRMEGLIGSWIFKRQQRLLYGGSLLLGACLMLSSPKNAIMSILRTSFQISRYPLLAKLRRPNKRLKRPARRAACFCTTAIRDYAGCILCPAKDSMICRVT